MTDELKQPLLLFNFWIDRNTSGNPGDWLEIDAREVEVVSGDRLQMSF
jgi:hypothetical protein